MKKCIIALMLAAACSSLQALALNWSSTTTIPTGLSGATLVYTETAIDNATIADAVGGKYTTVAATPHWIAGGTTGYFDEIAATNRVVDKGTYFVFFTSGTDTYWWASIAATDTEPGWSTSGGQPNISGLKPMTFQTHIVPEPTVLALLALGVAGLALRRKA